MKPILILIFAVSLLTKDSYVKNIQSEPLYYYVLTSDTKNKYYVTQVVKFSCDQNSRFYSNEENIERAIQMQYLDHIRTKENAGYIPFRFVKFFKSANAANIAKRKELASLKNPKNTVIEDFTFRFYCVE